MQRLRDAVRPRSVIQELANMAFIISIVAAFSVPLLGIGLTGVLVPHGIALGLWFAAGWMWLRGVGE